MRKFFVLFMLFFATISVAAQQNIFPSRDECATALLSDNYTTYEPKYFGLKDKDPVDGKSKILAPLESKACVHMLTTGGKQWVVQVEGTEMRWNANKDGSLGSPYARNDCGNPIYGIYYPVKPEPVKEVATPTPQVAEAPTPQVVEEKEQLPPIFDSNVPTQGQERKTSRIYKYRYRIGGAAAVIGTAAWAGRYFWCLW
jgi:hypothetical protein